MPDIADLEDQQNKPVRRGVSMDLLELTRRIGAYNTNRYL